MPGSQTPGAVLRSAFARYTQRAGERDMCEGIGDLHSESLSEAVQECVDAAREELSSLLQEELLRSASYGKRYWDAHEKSGLFLDFQKTAGFLRVLNALRAPKVGLYLTAGEFEVLKERGVISRLCSRRLYYLSVQVGLGRNNRGSPRSSARSPKFPTISCSSSGPAKRSDAPTLSPTRSSSISSSSDSPPAFHPAFHRAFRRAFRRDSVRSRGRRSRRIGGSWRAGFWRWSGACRTACRCI